MVLTLEPVVGRLIRLAPRLTVRVVEVVEVVDDGRGARVILRVARA